MINALIAALGLELDLSADEIADVIWLATQMQQLAPLPKPADIPEQPTRSSQPSSLPREKPVVPPKRRPEPNPQEPQAEIVPQGSSGTSPRSQELAFQVPDVRSLREPLTLARSLRPLLRRIASGHSTVLNEAATIQRIVEEQLWIPVLQPSLEPWLDLALVIDESDSMLIWRRTVTELQRLLENYGVFRTVRVWSLVDVDDSIQIRPGFGPLARRQRSRSPSELIDPNGRCLVLVVSDCVAPLWQSGQVMPALKAWSHCGAMAIVQMLPEWLWRRTALGLATAVQLQSLNPGVPNQQLIVRASEAWDEADLEAGIKVPVITLEPELFASWTQVVAGKGGVWTPGVVFEPMFAAGEDDEPAIADLTGQQRVQRFRLTASPMARRLAGLLAAAPVISLPIVRIVQDRLLQESRQVHVAEVFLGGLLKPLTKITPEVNPDQVQYDFFDGVREVLLESIPIPDSVDVLDAVSRFVASRLGLSLEAFAAVLRSPQQLRSDEMAGQMRPFARVTAQVLKRLGGDYAHFAAELEGGVQGEERSEPSFTSSSSPDYIVRRADRELIEGLKAGEFCYVFNTQYMGKTKFYEHAIEELQSSGFVCAVVNLNMVSTQNISVDQWYGSILDQIINVFDLHSWFDLTGWWEENSAIAPARRFSKYLEEILLPSISSNIVIFFDEIDSIQFLGVNTDDFFMAIRECYDRRIRQPEFQRLNFVMLGIATPAELMQDRQRSSFNVGRLIELAGFTLEEAQSLIAEFRAKTSNPQTVLRAILEWTGGQPLLTKKLCQLVAQFDGEVPAEQEALWVTSLVQTRIINNWEVQGEQQLLNIRDQLLYRNEERGVRLLGLYQQILRQNGTEINNSLEQRILWQSGLVVRQGNQLKVSNSIYSAVFDLSWVNQELANLRPYAEAFSAWERSGFIDKSCLLKGQALIDAQTWAIGKVLSDRDYQFLGDSQEEELDKAKIAKNSRKKTVLFLGGNPAKSVELDVQREVSEIDEELKKAERRNKFELQTVLTIKIRDIQAAILQYKPQIIHFAGYGVEGQVGLVLEDASGQVKLASEATLASIFRLAEGFVECVVLNACYSEAQANAIAQHIPYVVGLSQQVEDGAARAFSFGFYNALGSGESYDFAYEWGCSSILVDGFSDSPAPILLKKSDSSASSVINPEFVDLPRYAAPSVINPQFIDIPEGSISTDSPLYIERPPIEQNCYEAILRSGALIRIKSPRQMGKTSLQQRILQHAEDNGHRTGYINFQLVDPESLTDLDKFLQWFCQTVTNELELEDKLEDYWKATLSTKARCTHYFKYYLLKEIENPLTLGLDEVDQVFQHLEIADGFFGLLRVWHEQSKDQKTWKKLRLVIAHCKEVYAPLNLSINQSLFTVGLPIDLSAFNREQVAELVSVHGLDWSSEQVDQLMGVVDGHPYLLRKALYEIVKGNLTLEEYSQVAYTEEGLYGDHLSRHWHTLRENSALADGMRKVVTSDKPVQLEQTVSFRLRSMGLVEFSGNNVAPVCSLYKVYFRNRL